LRNEKEDAERGNGIADGKIRIVRCYRHRRAPGSEVSTYRIRTRKGQREGRLIGPLDKGPVALLNCIAVVHICGAPFAVNIAMGPKTMPHSIRKSSNQ
jgi:hypothetical protein